ncbi:hypothetical protein VXJ36_26210 [Pseudomonas nitroreducens]|uniref:hypothetical protein n=1 Tax=Pseudomonas nitroreducens TaxID=46680 RepID=UPI002F3604EE
MLMLIRELQVELPGQQEQAADVKTRMSDERREAEHARRAGGMPAEQAAAIAVEITTARYKEESSSPMKPTAAVEPGEDS